MNLTVMLQMAISLAIGLIIGMERGWESRKSPMGLRIAGIRSFGFVGLLGGLSAILAAQLEASVLVIAFLGLALVIAPACYGDRWLETSKVVCINFAVDIRAEPDNSFFHRFLTLLLRPHKFLKLLF